MQENEKPSICQRNFMLDCKPGCPLYAYSKNSVQTLADQHGVTFDEAIKKIRSMRFDQQVQILALIKGGLQSVKEKRGIVLECDNEKNGLISDHFGFG